MTALLGQFFALLTALCWTQNSLIYAHVGKKVGSPTVTHIRLWLALPMVLAAHWLVSGTLLPQSLSGQVWGTLLLSGLIGFCVADLFIFRSFVVIGARETMVIMTLSPLFAAFLSWIFFGEALSLIHWAGIVIALAGVALVVFEKNGSPDPERPHPVKGAMLALAGAAAQAGGMILAKGGMGSEVAPLSANLIRISGGLVGLAVFALLRRQFFADFRRMREPRNLLLLTSAAFVGPVLGIVLTLYALTLAPVGIVTTLMQLSPVMLLPIERFAFKKRVTSGAVAGTVLAVAGAAFLFLF